jgi:SAM-dependent methyltransferase
VEFKFDSFKKRANDPALSKWEKIGFPDSYRKDREFDIFLDIDNKLNLSAGGLKVLDLGCGCSDLVNILVAHSVENNNFLDLVDSAEMLDNIERDIIKNDHRIKLIPGRFPEELSSFIENGIEKYDSIIVYSVIQYVFLESSIFSFIHHCLRLLKPGGKLLIGDIPNNSVRNRFLNSSEGVKFAKNAETSTVIIQHDDFERIDDSIVISILLRFRAFNCETYLLPQNLSLPFSNRREDILIIKR